MVPSDPSALSKDKLEFVCGAMIYTGWIPLQIWRDEISYLLEGDSKYPKAYNYDSFKFLNWTYHAWKAKNNSPEDFQQQGIQQSLLQVPVYIKPLFQVAVCNMFHNALLRAKYNVQMSAWISEQKVQIQCSNDALPETEEALQVLEEDMKLIQREHRSISRGWQRQVVSVAGR